jgi:SAM-dependent methyltransferase
VYLIIAMEKELELIEEYSSQQSWRNWKQYLHKIPISPSDHILDLGCSIGGVAHLFSEKVSCVTGIDSNSKFINYCNSHKKINQHFICSDFTGVNYKSLTPVTGVWSSFAISYLKSPENFLRQVFQTVQPDSWIALVDVACFLSGNMLLESRHYDVVKKFEIESYNSGSYDFNFGSKMELLLEKVGFTIIHVDNDITDCELNFNGAADSAVLASWAARLHRMQGLQGRYPDMYPEICSDIITSLRSNRHSKNNNVRFVVARKV